jgi:hypothetical protein
VVEAVILLIMLTFIDVWNCMALILTRLYYIMR